MGNEFLKQIVKNMKDEDTMLVSDIHEKLQYVDTGSYALNAICSTSIYGGVCATKVTAFAGVESAGKTFYVMGILKNFLETNKNAGVVYYDSEDAVTKELFASRGIDASRVIIVRKYTVQDFKTHALNVLEGYLKTPEDKRPPMMMVLDSMGQLSTTKELEDSIKGSETKDMTRTQVLKAAFRTLNGKLAKAGIALLVTNHVYAVIGTFVKMNEMSGGSGLKYTASQTLYLSKKQDKDGNVVVGNIIKVKMQKSRISREKTTVETRIKYDGGLDRYYGLLPLAVDAGLFENVAGKYRVLFGPEVVKASIESKKAKSKKTKSKKGVDDLIDEKVIYKNPKKYFNKEVLDMLDVYCKKHFSYGAIETEEEDAPIEVGADE